MLGHWEVSRRLGLVSRHQAAFEERVDITSSNGKQRGPALAFTFQWCPVFLWWGPEEKQGERVRLSIPGSHIDEWSPLSLTHGTPRLRRTSERERRKGEGNLVHKSAMNRYVYTEQTRHMERADSLRQGVQNKETGQQSGFS